LETAVGAAQCHECLGLGRRPTSNQRRILGIAVAYAGAALTVFVNQGCVLEAKEPFAPSPNPRAGLLHVWRNSIIRKSTLLHSPEKRAFPGHMVMQKIFAYIWGF
jgi:hypothetical protein